VQTNEGGHLLDFVQWLPEGSGSLSMDILYQRETAAIIHQVLCIRQMAAPFSADVWVLPSLLFFWLFNALIVKSWYRSNSTQNNVSLPNWLQSDVTPTQYLTLFL